MLVLCCLHIVLLIIISECSRPSWALAVHNRFFIGMTLLLFVRELWLETSESVGIVGIENSSENLCWWLAYFMVEDACNLTKLLSQNSWANHLAQFELDQC